MKKYIYLRSGIFKNDYLEFENSKRKVTTKDAIILQYDTEDKSLSVVDLINQNQTDSNTSSKYVLKEELEEFESTIIEQIGGFFKIQGRCSYDELEEKEKIKGHWWQVDNKEYVWNGENWVEIGFEISLEEYAKKVELPTKVSDLDNDEGFITAEALPTKVSDLDNDEGFITEHQSLEEYAKKVELPTKVSDLDNDEGFITGYIETDPIFAAQSGQFATKSEIADLISDELDPKFAEVSGTFATKSEIADLISDELDPKFAEVSGTFATKSEIADLISDELDPKFAAQSGMFALNENTENNINYLITKLSKVIKEVDALKREANITINTYNPQIISSDDNKSFTVNNDTADAIITSDEISGKASFNVKSVEIDNSTFDIPSNETYTSGNAIFINSQEDASITNSNITTNYNQSSNVLKLTSAEVFKLDGVTTSGSSYNTVMTGQNTNGKYLKYADITNCTFDDISKHVYIWFAGWQDNAVLNIKNCTFKSCEQFLCLSDFHAENGNISGFENKLTVNIENCEIETYENADGDQYSGIILCDSRHTTGTLASQFATLNPFGNGKVTINIKNVTAGGIKLTKDNFLIGTKTIGQMLYVYQNAGAKNYDFNETNKSLFPTVYVDGELISQLE